MACRPYTASRRYLYHRDRLYFKQASTAWHDSRRRTLLSVAMLSHGLLTVRSSLKKKVCITCMHDLVSWHADRTLCHDNRTLRRDNRRGNAKQAISNSFLMGRCLVSIKKRALSHRPPSAVAFSAAGGITALKVSIQRWLDVDRLQDRLL